MDAIGTDNANKTVLFLLLIGLLVFYIYTLTFGPFSCCVFITSENLLYYSQFDKHQKFEEVFFKHDTG